jgi:uncharacterized delta-60 repeat protein
MRARGYAALAGVVVGILCFTGLAGGAAGGTPKPPTIKSFSPTLGEPGTTVAIKGGGLAGTSAVTIGGTPATITSVRASQVTVRVGDGTSTGAIALTAPGGSVTSTGTFVVPEVVRLEPCLYDDHNPLESLAGQRIVTKVTWTFADRSDVAGFLKGQILTLRINNAPVKGANWEKVGRPGPNGTWLLDFRYDTGVTAGAVGSSFNIEVHDRVKKPFTDGYHTYTKGQDLFVGAACTITVPPRVHVDSISPTSGPVGSTVTISGENLDRVTAVKFGNVESPLLGHFPPDLKAKVPVGAPNGPITVVQGTLPDVTSSQSFTVTPSAPLSITSVTPSRGVAGTQVTIDGTGLYSAFQVRFGGGTAAMPAFDSTDDEIKVLVPFDSHTGPVTVSDGTHTAASPGPFTYVSFSGVPDTPFGTDGTSVVDIPIRQDQVTAVAEQADGKIVEVGISQNTSDIDDKGPAIVRVNPDGSPDGTFGANGVTLLNKRGVTFSDVGVETDGKILATVSDGVATLARFLPNGTLDSSWGDGGFLTPTFPACQLGTVKRIVVLPSGKFLLGGADCFSGMAVGVFNQDGTVDTTFGQGGVAGSTFSENVRLEDMAMQADGKIVLAGSYFSPFDTRLIVTRLNADGSVDTTFGDNGQVVMQAPDSFGWYATGVAVDAAGRIDVVARTATIATGQFTILRLTTDGVLDTSFASGGTFVQPSSSVPTADIVTLPNGNLIAGGGAYLAELDAAGNRDPAWQNGGSVTTGGAPVQQLVLQADGKLLVAEDGGEGFAVARLLVDPPVVP